MKLHQSYARLGLDESSTQEQVKERFAALVRQYHPDTGQEKADTTKLEEVRTAYKFILRQHSSGSKADIDAKVAQVEHDIRHTAPQHRQYLEYGGIGLGTPSQRQRQYQQYRVRKAAENVMDHALEKAVREADSETAGKDSVLVTEREKAYFSKKAKVTQMIERVVEDLILSSMANGEFSNLKGSGKPLQEDYSNPYIDETEKRLNKILKNSGMTPLWISREAEIRQAVQKMRTRLRREYARYLVSQELRFRNSFIYSNASRRWSKAQSDAEQELDRVNASIRDYNLIAPTMDRQFMQLRMERECRNSQADVEKDYAESELVKDVREALIREHNFRTSSGQESGFLKNILSSF